MPKQNIWFPGQAILYREVTQGRVWTARPVTVVRDTPELVALHLRRGAVWRRGTPVEPGVSLLHCKAGRSDWRLDEVVCSFESTLLLIYGAEAHATHVMWNAGREFAGWYVNLQEPLRRTPLGFDFLDQELDVVVQPNGQWRWKDEEHLAQAEELGLFSPVQTRAIWVEAQRVIEKIEAQREPFDSTWVNWRPAEAGAAPRLPAGWEVVAYNAW